MSMGSGAAEGLQQVLQRLFMEAKFKQEQQEHADRMSLGQQEMGLRERGQNMDYELGQGNLGYRGKEFDRAVSRDAVSDQQYTAGEPMRAANLSYVQAQTNHLNNPAPKALNEIDLGGSVALVDPATGVVQRTMRKTAAPSSGNEGGVGAVVQQAIGPDGKPILLSVNPRTGQASPIQMPHGVQPNRPSRPVTGMERNAAAFFARMLNAEKDARSVEDQLTPAELAALDYSPEMLGNLTLSSNAQKYKNAQRTYTEARLRKESGAAIPPQEFESDRTTNFRRTGDKAMDQKRNQRLTTLRGLGTSAGQGLAEHFGEGANLDELLKEFAAQQQAQPASDSAAKAAELLRKYGGGQ